MVWYTAEKKGERRLFLMGDIKNQKRKPHKSVKKKRCVEGRGHRATLTSRSRPQRVALQVFRGLIRTCCLLDGEKGQEREDSQQRVPSSFDCLATATATLAGPCGMSPNKVSLPWKEVEPAAFDSLVSRMAPALTKTGIADSQLMEGEVDKEQR